MHGLRTTTARQVTSRSVLYVGYTCDIRCRFCDYTHHPDRRRRSLADTRSDALLLGHVFGHHRVDITGGKPNIYLQVVD